MKEKKKAIVVDGSELQILVGSASSIEDVKSAYEAAELGGERLLVMSIENALLFLASRVMDVVEGRIPPAAKRRIMFELVKVIDGDAYDLVANQFVAPARALAILLNRIRNRLAHGAIHDHVTLLLLLMLELDRNEDNDQ